MCFSKKLLCLLWVGGGMFLSVGVAHAQSVLYVDGDASAGGDGTSWTTAFNDRSAGCALHTGGSQLPGVGRGGRGGHRPFGAEPPAPDQDGDTNGSEGPCLTTAYIRVLQVGDSWIYDELREGLVNGEVMSVNLTYTITVSPDMVVDLAGNTARVLATTEHFVGEDGTETTFTGGEYFSQDPDGTLYKHGEFNETPFERFIQVPPEGKVREIASPVAVGDTTEWDIVYDDGTTLIGGIEVVGIESVTVPAGHFVAAKFRLSFTATTETTTNVGDVTAWVVPELGLWVKTVADSTFRIEGDETQQVQHQVRELSATNVPGIETCPDEDGDRLVTICHRPPGNPDNARTITVGINASAAHLALHGDCCGPCP